MKTKKLISLALVSTMALTLAACGNNSASGSTDQSQTTQVEAAVQAESTGPEGTASETASSTTSTGDYYPGGSVQYRENDPAPDENSEITSTDQITWTVAACLQESNPQSEALKLIANELSEKTNGNFTWDIYFNSELGSESEAVELTRNNTVQFVTSNVTVMSPYVDGYSVFALPYVFHSEEDLLTYLATGDKAKNLYKELEEKANLVTLGFNCTGTRCLSTKGVAQAKSPEDFKGVKIRSMEAQVWQDVINCLGATPVPVAYTELYTALQTGVVQGQDNPVANTVDGKFYEVLDTFYENDHAFLISGYYTNPESWDALPDDYKSLLEGLMAKYMGDYYHIEIRKFQEEAKQTMIDSGVKIVPQSELDMDAFYEAADKMIEEKYMSNESYKSFVDDVKATFNY